MILVDSRGLPLAINLHSASPNEVTLIELLLEQRILNRRIHRLVYDLVADSDPLRSRLAKRGIDLITPHRRNRVKPPTQDGRKLRRYRKRWPVERSVSWFHNFRRLVVRYEYYPHLFVGFVQLACLLITFRKLPLRSYAAVYTAA
jgi:transposase